MNGIDRENIERFVGPLQSILIAELNMGNVISEAWHGNWPLEDTTTVQLKYPFKTPVRRDLADIEFANINDSHHWKAQCHDSVNRLLLTCGFSFPGDFEDM